MAESPWQDKRTLYKLYHAEGLDKQEIAERLGCSDATIGNWMRKLGVSDVRPWERVELVRRLYVDDGMTQQEVADVLGCDQTTISRVLLENGVETRKRGDYTTPKVYFSEDGYVTCRHRIGGRSGKRVAFRVHRLVAVAEYGFDVVDGNVVHHKNQHPADNRPENLQPVSLAEHTEMHHKSGDILSN